MIDWNGNVYLCPQDWDRRLPVGNVSQENFFLMSGAEKS